MSSRPESEWNDDQRAWMLALTEYRLSLCPCGCGNSRDDTLAPEGTHVWRTHRIRCQARTVLLEAQRAAAAEAEKTKLPIEAVLWSVRKG